MRYLAIHIQITIANALVLLFSNPKFMARVRCTKCAKMETVLKAGIIRGKQRFYCKECNYHFTINADRKLLDAAKRQKRKHQTTIVDIGKVLGISPSTVSRALNNHPDISLKTAQAVKDIASKMDYQPNLIAQSLSSKETHTIGVVIPNLDSFYFTSILSGIQDAAVQNGYKVMICQSKESSTLEISNVQTLMANWIDGLFICHSRETQSFEHIKIQLNKGIPIIHFGRICEDINTSKVIPDDISGGFEVTEHFIEQGCTKIAVLAGPEHLYISKRRLAGYKNALKKHGIPLDERYIAYTDLAQESMTLAVDKWLGLAVPPDAIFCISNTGAINTILHLKKKNIAVPDQICVASFGDEPISEIIQPSLTAFNPNTYKIGRTTMELFLSQLVDPDKRKTKCIKGELIVRGSSLRSKKP